MVDFFGADQGDLYTTISKWRAWVSSTNEKQRDLSHTLFTGGKFDVPDAHHEDFLSIYARDVENKVPHYLNELRTAVFKMFLDIDYVGDVYVSHTDALAFCVFAQKVLREFYPTAASSMFVAAICTAPAKQVSDGVKTGIHLHFPYLRVSTTEAMLMRKMLVYRLEESSLTAPVNGWDDAVDEKVFIPRTSGLRMLGSYKIEPCSRCATTGCSASKAPASSGDGNSCELCFGKGRVRQNRPYSLTTVLSGDGCVDDANSKLYKHCFVKAIFLCSIRCVNARVSPGFERVPGCPSFLPLEKLFDRKGDQIGYRQVSALKGEKNRAVDNQCVVDDAHVLRRVEWIVRNVFRQPAYSNLKLHRVTYNPRSNAYTVRTRAGQVGSNFCLNKMADHTSSNVYFQILKSGAVQRCWCRKTDSTNRLNGPCSTWVSRPRALSTNDAHILFCPSGSDASDTRKRKDFAA